MEYPKPDLLAYLQTTGVHTCPVCGGSRKWHVRDGTLCELAEPTDRERASKVAPMFPICWIDHDTCLLCGGSGKVSVA